VFYRRQAARETILETLALLAEGVRISSISRAKGIKEDPILAWLQRSPAMVAGLTDHLWSLEELLAYVPVPNNT
jgi:hypothetical protein